MTKVWTVVASDITDTNFTQINVLQGSTYKYRVKAKNSKGFGPYSSESSISIPLVDVGTVATYGDWGNVITINNNLFLTPHFQNQTSIDLTAD